MASSELRYPEGAVRVKFVMWFRGSFFTNRKTRSTVGEHYAIPLVLVEKFQPWSHVGRFGPPGAIAHVYIEVMRPDRGFCLATDHTFADHEVDL